LRQIIRLLSRLLYGGENPSTTAFWRKPLTEVESRALELLNSCLSSTQRQQYETHRYFDVIGGQTGCRYRIRHGHQMNVESLDSNGQRTQILCFMPECGLPIGDVLLAQKLALELFELEALSIANTSPLWYIEYEERFGRRYRD
jgi:hypothetical protein